MKKYFILLIILFTTSLVHAETNESPFLTGNTSAFDRIIELITNKPAIPAPVNITNPNVLYANLNKESPIGTRRVNLNNPLTQMLTDIKNQLNQKGDSQAQGSKITNPVEAFFGTTKPDKSDIMQFQESKGLTVDGIIGRNTMGALNQILKENPNAVFERKEPEVKNPPSEGPKEPVKELEKIANTNFKDAGEMPGEKPDGNLKCGKSNSGSNRLICEGIATTYAHGSSKDGCVADVDDQKYQQTSKSGQVMSRKNVPTIPAVALPPVVYRKYNPTKAGYKKQIETEGATVVEVKDMKTGKCIAFPLLDEGPAPAMLDEGKVIDLTGSAYDLLTDKPPCDKVANKIAPTWQNIPKVQYAVNVNKKVRLKPGEIGKCTMLK